MGGRAGVSGAAISLFATAVDVCATETRSATLIWFIFEDFVASPRVS